VDSSRDLLSRYLRWTRRSREAYERAKRTLPGGNSREAIFYPPYPIYVKRAEGCRIWDLDGHEVIDFANNYLSLILGHAHPKVVESVKTQVEDGTAYSSPTEYEYVLGEMVEERMPSIEKIRYTNSGSEAATLSILASRSYTGRVKIAKFEGGHHGTCESTMVSTRPPISSDLEVKAVPDGYAPYYVVENTIVLPFNNIDAVERVIKGCREELAAVIVEPVLGSAGVIPAEREFLKALREATERYGIILIFDEVVTGFRVSAGGGQEYYGVRPDLTVLGKILGGGFPIGALGGRGDVMSQFDPTGSPKIHHSGSFNANPVSMRAGIATLKELTPEVYARLNRLGGEAARGLRIVFEESHMKAKVTQIASLFAVHFTGREVYDYRSATSEDPEVKYKFFLRLLMNGVMLTPRGIGCISTPMTRLEVETLHRCASEAAGDLER